MTKKFFFSICAIGVICAMSLPLFAQQYIIPQTFGPIVCINAGKTGAVSSSVVGAPTYIGNVGQISHSITWDITGSPLQFSVQLEGSDDATNPPTNWTRISDVGTTMPSGGLTVQGIYKGHIRCHVINLQDATLPTSTVTVKYTAVASGGGPTSGVYAISSASQNLTTGQAANLSTQFNISLPSSGTGGILYFTYSDTSCSGSTINVQAGPDFSHVANVLVGAALSNITATQAITVPAAPANVANIIFLTGCAFVGTATMDISYSFSLNNSAGGGGGGSGGCPGGVDGEVLFNDMGACGADAGFTYDKTNVVIGIAAKPFIHATGTNNAFFGDTAGNYTLSGTANTGGGLLSLNGVTTGNVNTGWGSQALRGVTTGGGNVALGSNAGLTIAGGNYNTFLGTQSDAGSSGLNNATAIGGLAVVSADDSMALGNDPVKVGIGTSTPGSKLDIVTYIANGGVTFTGAGLDDMTVGGTFLNRSPCSYTVTVNTPGAPDTFDWDDGACGNSATGVSMAASVTVSYGTALLFAATTGHTAGNNWAFILTPVNALNISNAAGMSVLKVIAQNNSAVITEAGIPFLYSYPVLSSSASVFLGYANGNFTNTASDLTAIGDGNLVSATSGSDNVAVGDGNLASNTSGSRNVAIGAGALGSNISGGENNAIGDDALGANITGSNSAALGKDALHNQTTGTQNTGIGPESCRANVYGSSNTCLGYRADVGDSGLTNATAIGQNAVAPYSDTLQLGAVSTGSFASTPYIARTYAAGLNIITNDTTINTIEFVGSGLNDATSGGTFTGTVDSEYCVKIDATGAPDTFSWGRVATPAAANCTNGAAGVNITGAAQTLSFGAQITFAATTGHTLNDSWLFEGFVPVALTVDSRTQLGTVHFGSLGTVMPGQTFYCDDCDPSAVTGVANQCTSAGTKTGAWVVGTNAKWACMSVN